jgi:hypothetical protein
MVPPTSPHPLPAVSMAGSDPNQWRDCQPAARALCWACLANVREKYTREVKTARAVARDYFERFPKDRYKTSVEVGGTCSATTMNSQ